MRIIPATALLVALCAYGAPALGETDPPAPEVANVRFFTTPDQRAALDRLRAARPPAKKKPVPKKAPPPLPRVEVQGVVVRSGGPGTVWINDGNTLDGDRLPGGLQVEAQAGGRARVVLPNDESFALRPGQSYDPARGATGGISVRKGQ